MKKKSPGYEFFEHTADVGLKVYGRTISELFRHAASGLIEILVDTREVLGKKRIVIKADGSSIEDLLVSWLEEILYYVQVKRILLKKFGIVSLQERQITAWADGERYSPSRHHLKTEVKAVTHHNLKIEKSDSGWQSEIIIDI